MTSLSLKMAALNCFQLSTVQTSVTFFYFSFNFDQVCDRLHGLIRACISDWLAFNVANPLKSYPVTNPEDRFSRDVACE